MYYPDIKEYITFLFFMLDEFSATQETVSKRDRPQTYADASLIVFYAVMTLKGITAISDGFPVMFQALSANVNARKVLDTKKDRLIEKGVRCIVADNGYVDKKRQAALVSKDDVLLLTPKTTLAAANAFLGARSFVYRNTSRNMETRSAKSCY